MKVVKRISKVKFYYRNDSFFKSKIDELISISPGLETLYERESLFLAIKNSYPDLNLQWIHFLYFIDGLKNMSYEQCNCSEGCKTNGIFYLTGKELINDK